jgi:hypothetical protein
VNDPRDQSVRAEPHLGGGLAPGVCERCGYQLIGLPAGRCPECNTPYVEPGQAGPSGIEAPADPRPVAPREREDNSAWDEPALSGLAAAVGAETFGERAERRRRETSWTASWATTAACALAAGPWAVVGAMISTSQSTPTLNIVLFGPVVEEAMKIAAAALVLERWPHLFKSRAQIMIAGIAGGLVFSVIENLLYLHIYFPEAAEKLAPIRWGLCTPLHVACSAVASVGLLSALRISVAERRRPDLTDATGALIVAVALHSAWNAFALFFGDRFWGF